MEDLSKEIHNLSTIFCTTVKGENELKLTFVGYISLMGLGISLFLRGINIKYHYERRKERKWKKH